MSSTFIEQTRSLHADIEKSVRNVVYELQNKSKMQRATVYQNNRINKNLEKIQNTSEKLLNIYFDGGDNGSVVEGFRKEEINSMKGDTLQKTLNSFDTRLAEVREYHRKFSSHYSTPQEVEDELMENENPDPVEPLNPNVTFTGEEGYGRYVDLHHFYNEFINMPQFKSLAYNHNDSPIDYPTFLDTFYLFHKIGHENKDHQYKDFLERLYSYFLDFFKRSQPLSDISNMMKSTEESFEKSWNEGNVLGWEFIHKDGPESDHHSSKTTMMKKTGTEEPGEEGTTGVEGAAISSESSKSNLAEMKNQFSNINGTNDIQNSKGKRKRNRSRKKKKEGLKSSKSDTLLFKSIAFLEAKISRFVEVLGDVIEATKLQIQKKQTRTWEEIQAELEREEEMELELLAKDNDEVEEKEEENQYDGIGMNPLNLPLGLDGKPIPYWLYKLHGLGLEFKCEICGGYSYWGPRAFERHFQEWRHAHSMKCLKIPNTRHFHHVTKISDALNLWKKLRKEASTKSWKNDFEEFEDEHGNIFNRKTYEDMKNQGLL